MSQPTDPVNPYAPPTLDPKQADWQPSGISPILQRTIREFRQQSLALGAAWIILGMLAGIVGVVVAGPLADQVDGVLLGIVVVCGVLWTTLGVFTCLRKMWAVYTGLVLSYISVVGNLLGLNLCALVILIVIIVQAHRVIGFARTIQRAGLSLNTASGSS
jgi:hypothetical protein